MITIPFTKENREEIIKAQKEKGLILIEEQLYRTGHFLVFDKSFPVPVKTLEQRVADLEVKTGLIKPA